MGVQGLWRILQPAEETVRLPDLEGLTIGVDLAIWMCHDMTVKYNSAVTLKLYVRNLFFRIVSLLMHGALPVGVCDGPAPALKLRTMQQRQQKNNNASKVTTSTKRTHFRRIAKECCSLLELLGVPHLESPGEAESMCAHLNSQGKTDACLTADGDAFLYGAETVYSGLSLAKGDSGVAVFRSARIREELGLDRARLVTLGLLLGCDFIASAKGVGPKKAMTWMRGLTADIDLMKVLKEAADPGALEQLSISDRLIVSDLLSRLESHYVEVISEFFSNTAWPLPSRKFSWQRPQPFPLIMFCAKRLDWEESYALEKILPIVAAWDLRHPRILKEPALCPLSVLRKRQMQFVPSFEVEWTKFGFDNWTPEECYTFCVPQHPFSSVHSDLVSALELRADKKKKKEKKEKKNDSEKENEKEEKENKGPKKKKKEKKVDEEKEEKENKEKREKKKDENEDEDRERRRRFWEDELVDDLSEQLGAVVLPKTTVASAFRVNAWTPGQTEVNLELKSALMTPECAGSKRSSRDDQRIPSFFSPCSGEPRTPTFPPCDEESPLPLLQRLARRKAL